jgi:uncharacterized repeat protein (TIGR01451 family)
MNSSSPLSLRLFTCFISVIVLIAMITSSTSARTSGQIAPAIASDLAVFKSAEETVAVGGLITYSLSVYNAGPDEAYNIVLTDVLPANTTFVNASNNNGTVSFDGTTLTVNFRTLAFDATTTATLVVRVNQDTPRGTIISNTVTGTSDIDDPDTSNNSATTLTQVTGPFAGDILISEFRLRGPEPNGAANEFIELYNNTDTPLAVSTTDDSAGWAITASDGVVRFVIPNGTIIPARGHFLGVNATGYSLSSYPSGNDGVTPTTATGDATYTLDIPDNAGIAVFRTSNAENFSTATRLDAAGSTTEENTLYKEGNGYPAIESGSSDYSFVRDTCGKGGFVVTFGPCTTGGLPKDTNDNAADFFYVDTNGTSTAAGQRLGAPGPENLSSPTQQNAGMPVLNLDQTVGSAASPNRVRELTSDPENNSTFGTIDFRRRLVNQTGQPVTRLRFRIIDITTLPAPAGIADLRVRTSTDQIVNGVNDAETCPGGVTPCSITVLGTTLEQPPDQGNGGGFNSSLSADTITLETPLAPGDSIDLHFLFGVQQTGLFKFYFNVELLTGQSGEGMDQLIRVFRKTARGTSRRTGIPVSSPAPQQPAAVPTSTPVLRTQAAPQPAPESERPKGASFRGKQRKATSIIP